MRKYFVISFFVLIICFLTGPINVFAQDASSTPTKINARILPTVWYSTLSVNDGDSIKIYSAIQNNSGINFTGNATFYVDDKEISKVPFSSTVDNLKDISASWLANPGDHSIQVKISTSLPADKILVSYESDKATVSITRNITPEVVQAVAMNTANSIVSNTDTLATALADKIESYKKPVASSNSSVISTNSDVGGKKVGTTSPKKGSVLGTSTGPVSKSVSSGNNTADSVFNIVLDALAFLVRNWKWTLGILFVLFLIFKFTGGRK